MTHVYLKEKFPGIEQLFPSSTIHLIKGNKEQTWKCLECGFEDGCVVRAPDSELIVSTDDNGNVYTELEMPYKIGEEVEFPVSDDTPDTFAAYLEDAIEAGYRIQCAMCGGSIYEPYWMPATECIPDAGMHLDGDPFGDPEHAFASCTDSVLKGDCMATDPEDSLYHGDHCGECYYYYARLKYKLDADIINRTAGKMSVAMGAGFDANIHA